MWFRYVSDLGIAGPDDGKGGRYLIVPPGYDGDGVDKAAQGVKDKLRIYPLSQAASPPKTEFISATGKPSCNAAPPNDFSYWEMLNQLVQEEPVGAHHPETRGLPAAIGITKDKPFAPDAPMKAILTDAVAIGNAYARTDTVFPRDPEARIYGPDSEGVMGFAGKDTAFLKDGARRYDARLWMHYSAVVATPAMAVTKPGRGSDYDIAGLGNGAQALKGAKTCKLTLPQNVPVKDFWSAVLYDPQTRAQLQTNQQFPALYSYGEDLVKNADGSYDVWFAPEAPKGHEGNWLQTFPSKSWFIILRMYGPLEPMLNQTWQPGEIELATP